MTRKIFGARRLWYSGNGIQTNLDFRYDAQTDRLIFSPIDFSHKPGGLDHGNDPQPDEQPYIELIASVLEADINALPALRIDCSGGEDSVISADLFLGASYDWHWVKARRKVTIEARQKNQTLVFDLSAARDENGLLSLEEDTTVKIILLPFGGKCKPGDTFSIRFAGFFSDAAGAFAFDENKESHILADCPQPYGKAFFEEAPLGSEKAEKFKKILDDRIREIVGCPSALKPEDIYARGGKCYFFSSLRGDDANDGLTPDTPKASMQALKDLDEVVRPGDAVFFERGSLWRSCLKTRYSGTYCFAVRHGVSYGAYGEGEKPRFYGSVSGKGAEKWQQTEYPNVWRFYRPFDQISSLGAVTRGFSDVGNIVFDGGKNWGIKIVPTSAKDGLSPTVPTMDSGMVSNGTEYFHSGGKIFTNPGDLENELEFFCDYSDETLYLFCSKGNPGEVFSDIEIATRGHLIMGHDWGGAENVRIDSLCLRHTGSHGIALGDVQNFTVENCEIGWIGGGMQCQGDEDSNVRYGNAIESYGSSNGFTVRHCYSYQVYDGTMTTQSSQFGEMRNAEVSGCVLTHGNSPIEFWTNYYIDEEGKRHGFIDGLHVFDNVMAYTGYHFGHQRPVKNASFFCIGGGQKEIFTDTVCENNICFCGIGGVSYGSDIFYDKSTGYGVLFRNNTYLMDTDRAACIETWGDAVHHCGENKFTRYNFYRYNERTVQFFLNETGTEQGTKFYYYHGPLRPEENDGVYRGNRTMIRDIFG